ncbi:site-specific integrase [Helcococcus ovis]|uniref:tyrosine-type recombinase/integrase n=1 Tax=Helcococcus TaxID=31983 RepID=UPI0038BBCA38
MAKRLKLPNGFGSVCTLNGKRRKKYAARITINSSPDGKQIRKYIGYYAKYADALNALSEYNTNPYDVDLSKFTLLESYENYKKWKFPDLSNSSILGYQAAFNHVSILHNKALIYIASDDLQNILDDKSIGNGIKRKIIVLFNQLYSYYCEDIPQLKKITNKLRIKSFVKIDNADVKEKVFTMDEIQTLWDNINNFNDLDIILILLYTGFRINELLMLKTKNVHLEEGYLQGGNKTKNSINRKIPIHSKIKKFIEKRYDPDKEYLIRNKFDERFKYSNFKRERFERIMTSLNMKHTPHDTRHTVATYLQINGADKIAIRQILGHAGKDITEEVYTHAIIENLSKNIELLK